MNLLNFLSRTKSERLDQDKTIADANELNKEIIMNTEMNVSNNSGSSVHSDLPPIKEELFVEYEKPESNNQTTTQREVEVWDLRSLYLHLSKNLEKNGYEDALINPDTSFMNEHLEFLKNDVNLLISKIKNYYSGYLTKIEFHIESRKRNGMVETVEELMNFKKTIERELQTVSAIEMDTKNDVGLSQNLFLSYRKGFKNGFAAITFSTILNRKF